ncbi:hypothetical protein Micbo1qcDRAFT_226551 [Microdochium bolleyi]|uniref:Uncharacterized protein n=1 Tax=Microdochium bolleyi TaxID=196109 RepID=A0A136J007_9PEZI|nr:hypothetical protein Micbo1qcDRAFT_226551 [Microdochium bolleyi]
MTRAIKQSHRRQASQLASPASSRTQSRPSSVRQEDGPSSVSGQDVPHESSSNSKTTTTTTTTTRCAKLPPRLTLGDRFALLPAELRADIFAHVLVQPAKWDIAHRPQGECFVDTFEDANREALLTMACIPPCAAGFENNPRAWRRFLAARGSSSESPLDDDQQQLLPQEQQLREEQLQREREQQDHQRREQRLTGRPPYEPSVTISWWHSAWAPPPLNPTLCSECYERRFRQSDASGSSPQKSLRSLPCLCARRRDLQTLLVCKAWYDEAGLVFYTRNTFAFGHPDEVLGFVAALPSRWRAVLTRVSFMVLDVAGWPETAAQELAATRHVLGTEAMRLAWEMLARELPALSYLEVDAAMLARPQCARVLMGLTFGSLRHIRFVQGAPEMWQGWNGMDERGNYLHVWPRMFSRRSIDGKGDDFAVEVARRLKGLTPGLGETLPRRVQLQMLREERKYLRRFGMLPGGDLLTDTDEESLVEGLSLFDVGSG